jgi:2-C-methyl-D-erythritol 4-phosphate cytidylyltransferase
MNSDLPKQYMELCGETVLSRTLQAFDACPLIDSTVAVVREEEREELSELLSRRFVKLSSVISGKGTRSLSAKAGFLSIPKETDIVVFHDAARCLITACDIEAVVLAAEAHGAATAAVGISDTVKRTHGGFVSETLNRDELVLASTPQAFSVAVYRRGLDLCSGDMESITDDNMIAERAGASVRVVLTSKENVKITTEEDLCYAEYILKRRNK